MTKRLWLAGGLTVVVAFLLATMAACDDGEEKVTPTATATPTAVSPEVEEQLQRMVLQLEDLPAGVVRAEERFVTNKESAIAQGAGYEERLAKLEEWGRILGYDVTYQGDPEEAGLILVNSTASLYGSAEGASASYADAAQTARSTDWADLFGGAQEVKVEEVDSPALTDEMLWLRITIKGQVGEEAQEETLANDVVILRQGPARASIQVAWVTGRASSELLEQLVGAQAQRLKDALAQ
ncbi:MAG: hypothetical protein ACUVV3_07175 [Dehalococcoidia bacterium]